MPGHDSRSGKRFSASVEVGGDGWATVWVAEFPGLFLNEPSERGALRALPGAIAAYLRWLRRHGEPVRMVAAPAVTVAQRYEVRPRLRWGSYADHEWWSARKMLGRFLYHERYHLRSMARIAAHHGMRVPEVLGGWAQY